MPGYNLFRNYIKIAYRNLFRHRLFSIINISGLALGLAVCIVITLWILNEVNYDRFHHNAHRIYRIERELFRDKSYSRWPITSGAYKQALINDFPEIISAVRLWRREYSITDFMHVPHRQNLFATDNSIFEIFDFSLEKGNENTALKRPMTVVLSRANAKKYLGTEDVIGKSLKVEWGEKTVELEITGILADVPYNSHIQFDMLISISSYPENQFSEWRSNYLYTYILAGADVSKEDLEEKLKNFVSVRLKPYYGDLLGQGTNIHRVLKLHLFPLTAIHLHPSPNWEIEAGGDIIMVYLFATIAFLILVIACINFVNLSTASAGTRIKEVSVRKTMGAGLTQIKLQFIQEFIFLALMALILALALVSLFIPLLNHIFGAHLSTSLLLNPSNIIILVGLIFLVGILSALYPALFLAKISPVKLLRTGVYKGTGRVVFRRIMVITQFAISIFLIIGTLAIYNQMAYIQSKSLGFDKENILLIPVSSQQIADKFETFRNELYRHPLIQSVTVSSDLPGEIFYSNTNFLSGKKPDEPVSTILFATDYNFVQTYKMKIVAGRMFSKEYASDTSGTIILNEAAVKRFGWTPQESIGETLEYSGDRSGKIVGVVQDFNYRSLHSTIEPTALILNPEFVRAISVRTEKGDPRKVIDFLRKTWEEIYKEEIFECSFLDNRINQLYNNELKMQNVFILFSFFSVFVACLGLFGLSVFITTDRTKEIGIRKVLGATTLKIFYLLSKEFFTWIIIAIILAWPLAWIFVKNWLQNFAYRTEIDIWLFLAPAAVALFTALTTLSIQVFRAARANPVISMRYE